MAKKLYLYKLLSNIAHPPRKSEASEGVFISEHWNIIGLDRTLWRTNKIRNFEQSFDIKQFEVRQNKFDLLILTAEKIGIKLIKIDFLHDLTDEEDELLFDILRIEDTNKIINFIYEQRFECGNDVEQVTFIDKGKPIRNWISLSREGVLTLNSNEENPQEVISQVPIGVLSGTYLPIPDEIEERYL